MKHVFILGSKGVPANYGGYETFVDNLVRRKKETDIMYYVACLAQEEGCFDYFGAKCFNIKVPNVGPAKAILYDVKAFKTFIKYIKENNIQNPVVYVLTCRIGPFFKNLVKQVHKLGGKVFLNPDGHEWKRQKWPWLVKKYWKLSEKMMVKYSDLVICDSINIEKYILNEYKKYKVNTTYIAYGADVKKSTLDDNDDKLRNWLEKFEVSKNEYYLVVGRFVPENNYEIIIREFIKSETNKSLVIITNVKTNKLFKKLEKKYNFKNDNRVKFVGTVYDEQLLKKIRELAFAYIHGHSVGGTNPSLLEALASTKLNLLFDVGFNKECAGDSALYFSDLDGDLCKLIDSVENMKHEDYHYYDEKSTNEIIKRYSWNLIIDQYESLFMERR